jgi:hypothetical protein
VSTAAAVLVVAGWLAGWLLAGRPDRLDRASATAGSGDGVTISVVIPARDEEARLPRLLGALASADPAPHEVLVVDDGSTDATAAVARAHGATVLDASPPAGWTGKSWACQQGAGASTGDVLLFLDADTEVAPAAVGRLAAAAASGDFVSALPRHRMERPYEWLSLGPGLLMLLGAGVGGPPRARWWRRPVAFGPAIAVRRDVYERFGGHALARADVAEDLALARAADRAGVTVRSTLGGDLIAYRMYPEGLRPLVEGWSKNLATGAGATPPLRLAATVVWVAAALQAPLLASSAPAGLVALVWAAFAVQVATVLPRVGRVSPLAALAYPALLAAFLLLFARSTVLTATRRTVPWRGRQVAVRG